MPYPSEKRSAKRWSAPNLLRLRPIGKEIVSACTPLGLREPRLEPQLSQLNSVRLDLAWQARLRANTGSYQLETKTRASQNSNTTKGPNPHARMACHYGQKDLVEPAEYQFRSDWESVQEIV